MIATDFNPKPATVMHIDLNSCFASIEQQANPLLRGKPVVVAAYTTGNGCILASSREAKKLGIKTGMNVGDGKNIYPRLVVLPPDPEKYRWVNRRLRVLMSSYTARFSVESIDEMVMDLMGTPALTSHLRGVGTFTSEVSVAQSMVDIGCEIKERVRKEIGDWLTVSIGIAPNRYLAKVASNLHKPDGLDIITKETILNVFATIQLEDLCGIKEGIGRRLVVAGITTPVLLARASAVALIRALHSKTGYWWWQRLHGWEDGVLYKDFESGQNLQKTFGQSFALGTPRLPQDPELWKILSQLIIKMGRRLRSDGLVARGISVSCFFRDSSYWHKNKTVSVPLFADDDFFRYGRELLLLAPAKLVRNLAVTSFDLLSKDTGQLPLWDADRKKRKITEVLDAIADRWGEFTVTPARMLSMEQKVLDRIAFGRIRELTKVDLDKTTRFG
ncbi:MAG: hypothetical protein AAB961_01185 [Patescibacteria group bacterium]